MSILANAGRAKIYNTDGTGRDTYIDSNSGGFSVANQPASAFKGGSFGVTQTKASPAHYAKGGGQGSPGKTLHYHTNGTGRDSYIACNQGGFASNYGFTNDREAYVASLRSYKNSNPQYEIAANVRKGHSPQRRDHFVEGQISIRSPQARNSVNMLKTYQRQQVDRLAMPKRNTSKDGAAAALLASQEFMNGSLNNGKVDADSPRSSFLRKTMQDSFNMRRSPSFDGASSGGREKFNQTLVSTRGDGGMLPTDIKKHHNGSSSLTANQLRNLLASQNSLQDAFAQQKNNAKGASNDIETNNMIAKLKSPVQRHKMLKVQEPGVEDTQSLVPIRIVAGNSTDQPKAKK